MQTLKKKPSSKPCKVVIVISTQPECPCCVLSTYFLADQMSSYDTELQTGNAIRKSGVPREEIFLATKLWMNSHHPDDVEACLDLSLKRLGTDYVDVLMMHYPVTFRR